MIRCAKLSRDLEYDHMNSKPLLTVSAVMELGAGAALAVAPSVTVSILFGTQFDSPTGLAVARLLGAALIAVGIACWLAHDDEGSRAARGVVVAMTVYNVAAAAVLASAGMTAGANGRLVWIAVIVHVAMTVWCVAYLLRTRKT